MGEGRVLVTGGAGVIGMATCRTLREAGWAPIAGDLHDAVEAVDWDDESNKDIAHVDLDVADPQSVDSAVAELDGELTGLVNCAGILRDTFLGNRSEEHMRAMFDVNIGGTARVTEAFAPTLRDGAAIVNIGSLTGYMGRFVGASVYGATKAGIGAYTTYLAVELAPSRTEQGKALRQPSWARGHAVEYRRVRPA